MYRRDGVLYRQIDEPAIADWEAFLASGLAERLVRDGRLIGHAEASLDLAATPDARAVIRPEPIEFVSYPYEWTFGELQDAALLDARRPARGDRAGWTLRTRPPTTSSSVTAADPHRLAVVRAARGRRALDRLSPVLRALPRAAGPHGPARRPARRLLRADPDGVPLDLAAALLPWRTRLNLGLLSHVHLHARAQRRYAGNDDDGTRAAGPGSTGSGSRPDREPARHRQPGCAGSRPDRVVGLRRPHELRRRGDRREGAARRRAARRDRRDERVGPRRQHGPLQPDRRGRRKRVLAFDIDPAAAERNYRQLREEGRSDILPLIMDLANPSPGIGWAGRERRSLLERADPDASWPLRWSTISRSRATCRCRCCSTCSPTLAPWAVVEFVPKEDAMVRHLLATRGTSSRTTRSTGSGRRRRPVRDRLRERPIEESLRVLFLLRRR